ncbi:Biofilm operon icaADBC HTH-type negative transcriptional regulator IcaR [Thermoflexales bacterium]|nr:Biofilm operon icaADBC HTH-type negative transcriptional regulator IcaR [Thermoflexales bacterium]
MSKKLEKLDPRVIRTRQMLRDALVSLIAEKGFDAITVQDIADRATLNRATFYLHYQDKHDLLVKSLRNAIDELMTDIGASTDEQGQLIFESPLRPIKTIFEHVAQHARFYQVMLSAEGVPAFSAGVRDYMAEVTLRWLSATQPQPQRSRVPLEIVASSLSWSLLGILIWWLEHDMPHSPEYMAGQFRLLITLDLRQVLGLEPAGAEGSAVS